MKLFKYLSLVVIINISVIAQQQMFNLKNVNDVTLHFQDKGKLLSSKIKQKMITETKLKLKSAGIEISKDSSDTQYIISVEAIQSNFARHRILLQVGILEKVQSFRKEKEVMNAFTYYDESFFKGKNITDAVYSEYMDTLLIRFIERYLAAN